MRVSFVCNCVLLAATLLATSAEGRSYPWHKSTQDFRYRYGKIQSREGRVSNHHQSQKTHVQASDLKELFDETLSEFLRATEPDNHLPQRLPSRFPSRVPARLSHRIMTNELQDIGIDPEQEELYSATVAEREELIGDTSRQRYLTSDYQNYHEEVCETRRKWTLLNETVDIDGNEVVIVNPVGQEKQIVYNYECVSPCSACKGVGVKSSCKMRYSYVKMYIRLKYGYRPEDPKWEFVSVPSHCACELVPDNFIDGECLD
ncbi:uncharacterized protein [Macrobrachium rosenbergii]|uniref:uncharacterized protein n=1 Tax=Macrobrachium rosenbergii TaxID=79674 RepID=UPI0034D7763E